MQDLIPGGGGEGGGGEGGAAAASNVQAFAQGGIVSSPTYFASQSGLGVMGEAGAEAVLPLARGSDGRLGVQTRGASGDLAASPINLTVNISTPDVDGFRKSQAQISSMLTRAVSRGRRYL